MIVRIDIVDFPAMIRQHGTRLLRGVRRGLLSAANAALPIVQQATREAPPANPSGVGSGGAVNTGAYLQRWKAGPTPEGARVYNAAPHAAIVEYGRRPGRFPPLRVIAQWAMRRMGKTADEAKRAAWPIARAIAQRGLLPRRVLTGVLPKIAEVARREVSAELAVEFERGGSGHAERGLGDGAE